MDFSASIINPLDIGGEFIKTHEDTGFTWPYREGAISLEGDYSVDLDRQRQWTNNKGPIEPKLVKLAVFAFKEERIGNSNYYFVDPDEVIDISDSAAYTSEDYIEISPVVATLGIRVQSFP